MEVMQMRYMTFILAIVLAVGLMVGCAQKPPTITKVEPNQSSLAGGTEITITGTGFKANPAPTVTIGGNPATGVKVISKTTLKATVPAGSVAGPADIVVQNAKAKVKSLPFKGFSYYEDVTATVSPDFTMAPPEGIEAPAKIDVTFNQDVDPASVVIKVTDSTGAEVAGKVAQDATAPKTFSFTPDAPFKSGDYTLTVSGAKGVAAGNVMTEMSQTFKVKEAAKPAKKGKK
ncbi:TPA: hypothetical protein ENX78_01760 [Candidatus Poribacteria bacterium]|nr:hypothetical protein [Candidatus Poribacteria bacterium]